MFNNLTLARFGRPAGAVLLFGALCLPLAATTSVSARSDLTSPMLDTAYIETVKFETMPGVSGGQEDLAVRVATNKFIRGMRESNPAVLWSFASEEDQEAFQTKEAVLQAFSETFPVLTQTDTATFQKIVTEGDTQMVTLGLRDKDGNAYQAMIGLSLDDASDWKVVSCDIKPADGRSA